MAALQPFTSTPGVQRLHQRKKVRWVATCETTSGECISGEILDISPFGMFVALPETSVAGLEQHEPVRLWFRTQDFASREVVAIGTLRWQGQSAAHGRFGVGIQFEDMVTCIAGIEDATRAWPMDRAKKGAAGSGAGADRITVDVASDGLVWTMSGTEPALH